MKLYFRRFEKDIFLWKQATFFAFTGHVTYMESHDMARYVWTERRLICFKV